MAVQTCVGNCAGRVGWMRASTAGTASASAMRAFTNERRSRSALLPVANKSRQV